MTDRELLEAAARAAGIDLEWDGPPDKWAPMYYEGKTYHAWNPLTDDGDALRLAVKLNMDVHCYASLVQVYFGPARKMIREDGGSFVATRRAIVRAAAALGALP